MTDAAVVRHPSSYRTVLVVDPDRSVRETFAQKLAEVGYRVETAGTADQAWRTFEETRPDAILIEVCLPTSTGSPSEKGFALLKRVRRVAPSVPIAVVTGEYFMRDVDSVKRMLDELGIALYFKPLWLEDLLRLAAQLVSAPASSPDRGGAA